MNVRILLHSAFRAFGIAAFFLVIICLGWMLEANTKISLPNGLYRILAILSLLFFVLTLIQGLIRIVIDQRKIKQEAAKMKEGGYDAHMHMKHLQILRRAIAHQSPFRDQLRPIAPVLMQLAGYKKSDRLFSLLKSYVEHNDTNAANKVISLITAAESVTERSSER